MSIDLRDEFAEIMQDAGHWMLLRKALLDHPCSCSNSQGETDSGCPRCNGLGYAFVDYLVIGRKVKAVTAPEIVSPVGRVAASKWDFYLMHNTQPTELDWILEISLDPVTRQPITPYRIKKYFYVEDVEDLRGDGGELIYFKAQCEESVWNVT